MDMRKYLSKFKENKVAVIGDLMIDKYLLGKVERISPEAPVPIVSIKEEKHILGGAGNTSNNIAHMTGKSYLFGVLGRDLAGNFLMEQVNKNSISSEGIIYSELKPTIQKTRVIAQNQHLLRIDYEDVSPIEKDLESQLIKKLKRTNGLNAIIISDYAKGTITPEICREVGKYVQEKNIPLIIDPKPNHKNFYQNVFLITPNKKEAEEMIHSSITNESQLEFAGKKLSKELNCNVLITRGEKGMSLFEKGKKPFHLPTVAQEVYDVSGAGDTVIATMCLALCSGASLKESAILANYAAGIKVSKLGTHPVSLEELEKALLTK